MTADEAVSVAAPRGLWHPKHDGSVSGPEFASQPGTLAYWRSIRPHIVNMYKTLLHGGLRSHDGDHAGMHVNIGNDAFTDAPHLARFAELIAVNPRWSTRMSQRTHRSQQSWASYDIIRDSYERDRMAEQVVSRGYATNTHHGSALNCSNPGRVEFRLPRGTLRVDRFYAKIEWTAAMIEYTRNADNVVQVTPFMKWASESGEYPYLTAYMRERFPARLATAEGGVA